ncbi:hypothetical protein KAJ83_13250 [Marivibrio halodurans]|uniref:Uncharacterized protein n=1 Tax=Marivibrio halodurans TaxID=2039722 RepID=A0A8J7S711_9PROT|nr:hypothetical protein [Marivibrio halodurans]MBP5857979.1 hypothetical protein [Marivibrio halodurans]
MLTYLKRRYFAATVAAEIRAQTDDQGLISTLLSRAWAFQHLEALRTQSYYRKEPNASFLHACGILEQGLLDQGLSNITRRQCYEALHARLDKAKSNLPYWSRHSFIFSGLLESLDQFSTTQPDANKVDAPTEGSGAAYKATEPIVSSEFPAGRYKLVYSLQTTERVRGQVIGTPVEYVLRSNDLETMYNIGLAKQMGGASVELTDTEKNQLIPLKLDHLPN